MSAVEKITHFDALVFRNIIGLKYENNVFDDLSDGKKDWQTAENAADFSNRLTASELQYEAIDYVFDQRAWSKTRFGDGSFPIWYGSVELNTSLSETIYHWKRFLGDAPALLDQDRPISCVRTVFKVRCHSLLVDLRRQLKKHPSLVAKQSYQDTQKLGAKLKQEGFPGLLAASARIKSGTNLAIFAKQSLTAVRHHADYLYEIHPDKLNEVKVLHYKSRRLVQMIK